MRNYRKTLRNTLCFIILAALVLPMLMGCGGRDDAEIKSIGEIHDEKGIPVSVRRAETATFSTHLTFFAGLRGAAESTASAMISDEVAAILHEVGDYVETDSPVVLFPSDNPALNYEQARVSYESARTAYERMKKLYEDEGVSQQTYDNARTQFEIAEANWESVLKMTRVSAPISGYITRIRVFESESVAAGTELFTVSDYARLNTTVWVSDRDITRVKVGQKAAARWGEAKIEGKVVQVDLAMDQERKAFAVKLEFGNEDLAVQSGVTAEVEIETFKEEDVFIAHEREIVGAGEDRFLFVAEGGRVERRKIEVLREEGLFRQLAFGIREGELIVTKGIELIEDGDKVRVVAEEAPLVQN